MQLHLLALAASLALSFNIASGQRAVRSGGATTIGGPGVETNERNESGFTITTLASTENHFKTLDLRKVRRLQEEQQLKSDRHRALKGSSKKGAGSYPWAPLFDFELALTNFLNGNVISSVTVDEGECISTQCGPGSVRGVVEGNIEDECAILIAAMSNAGALYSATVDCQGPLDTPSFKVLDCDESTSGDCDTDVDIDVIINGDTRRGFDIELGVNPLTAIIEFKCCTPYDLY